MTETTNGDNGLNEAHKSPLTEDADRAIEKLVRSEWGRVLASLIRYLGDIELAEDALQDALIEALRHWRGDGLPRQPRAWLIQTAKRKAIDRLRRQSRFEAKRPALEISLKMAEAARQERQALARAELEADSQIPDERLRLIFTCCHPAIGRPAQVALTLQTLGGLSTREIAAAFLVEPATMAQRLVRAKRKIRAAGIAYEVPERALWPERLNAVLSVLYLIYNEGHAATEGDQLTRGALCLKAIRLARVLLSLAPGEPEIGGLLALMLLHDGRRPARTDAAGEFVSLAEQDRSRWDRVKIDEGLACLEQAWRQGPAGLYGLQAALSAEHAKAGEFDATNWSGIVAIYDKLLALQPSPVVALNRAVAVSYAEDPGQGLALLEGLAEDATLARYQPFHAARADLLDRAGKTADAAVAYEQAIALSGNAAEQRYLGRRKAALRARR